jgi:hypothetical protein
VNGSYSAIVLSRLTVTDPSLLLDFSWKVHDDLCGSDHFPIILESLNSTVGERPTRYKFDKADWPLYEQMCREKLQKEIIRNATDPILKLNETVISIADETIPKTSANPMHPGKPWFNDDCKDAINNRKRAERRFGKHPILDNLCNIRLFRAKARRTLKQNRRTSCRNFVSKLNCHTTMNNVWNMVQKIKGKNNTTNVHHLKDGHDTLTSEQDISNILYSASFELGILCTIKEHVQMFNLMSLGIIGQRIFHSCSFHAPSASNNCISWFCRSVKQ